MNKMLYSWRTVGLCFQEHLIPNSAWKDYSAANTNYAFEPYESDEKPIGGKGGGGSIPMSTRPGPPLGPPPKVPSSHHNNGYGDTRSLQRPRGGGAYHLSAAPERSTYSLPRTAHPPAQYQGYYTHRPHSELQPDFYFMPSQRKYSGEVVRVYVDYNNTPKK